MNPTLIPILALIAVPTLVVIALSVRRAVQTPTLTPFQQIFADAKTLILTQGIYMSGGFTPEGRFAIGKSCPHCIEGAVAASDPNFTMSKSIYSLDSIHHLHEVARVRLDMSPANVNDMIGLDAVLDLLDMCIESTTL